MALCEKKNTDNREIQLKSDDWHCEVETCLSEPLALYKALIR